MSKLKQHREVWPNQSDEWLFERLANELSQKVETIHSLLDEKNELEKMLLKVKGLFIRKTFPSEIEMIAFANEIDDLLPNTKN